MHFSSRYCFSLDNPLNLSKGVNFFCLDYWCSPNVAKAVKSCCNVCETALTFDSVRPGTPEQLRLYILLFPPSPLESLQPSFNIFYTLLLDLYWSAVLLQGKVSPGSLRYKHKVQHVSPPDRWGRRGRAPGCSPLPPPPGALSGKKR